jgi:hypothetical protein
MLGYRDRNAWKSQQKQEQFGKAASGTARRVSLPAPRTMNLRDEARNLPPDHAPVIEDAYWSDGGLKIINKFRPETIIASASEDLNIDPVALISYDASGCASAEMWLCFGGDFDNVHNVGKAIDTSVSATASAQGFLLTNRAYDWTVFNKTIIMVGGLGGGTNVNHKWTRASGWSAWDATCSGASTGVIAGISQFKNRLIGWEANNTKFWYGSVDQPIGTLNPFELGGVLNNRIKMFATLSKDGGAGPDDYALFISETGEVAMYAGTDPGDANAWSLVGVFKIGRPLGVNSYVNYGAQTVILCEDDFYFLPQDLAGKRQSSLGVDRRSTAPFFRGESGIYYDKARALVFSDGSLFSLDGGMSYSNITLCSAEPWKVRQQTDYGLNAPHRPYLGMYKGNLYAYSPQTEANNQTRLYRLFPPLAPDSQQKWTGQIRTAPIQTSGRTNISLVNPLFGMRDRASASTSAYASTQFIYRTGVLYDTAWQPQRNLSLDSTADFFVTTSASSNSYGQWTPAFGTGDDAQIIIEVLSGSADDQELMLHGIDIIIEDTGGI